MGKLTLDKFINYGLIFSALVSYYDIPNVLALYFFIPLIFLFCVLRYRLFYESKYIIILACLVVWILLTAVTTHYWDLTIDHFKALFGTVMLCYITTTLALDKSRRPFLYALWILYFIGMSTYIPQMKGFGGFDLSSDRLNDGKLNANTVAMQTFYLTYVFYMLGDIAKDAKNRSIFKYLFFGTIPLSFIVALLTGSRQVLIIQIPLIIILLYYRYAFFSKKAVVYIVLITTSFFSAIFLADKMQSIYENSNLASRYGQSIEEDSRTELLKDAIQVGCEYPFTGVGPGNYIAFSYNKHFSHCSYTELFANCGVIGALIYIYLLYTFLKRQIKYYRVTKNKIFLIFLVFGVFFVIDNFLYVFYYSLWLFPFFFLIATHSDSCFDEILFDEKSKKYHSTEFLYSQNS